MQKVHYRGDKWGFETNNKAKEDDEALIDFEWMRSFLIDIFWLLKTIKYVCRPLKIKKGKALFAEHYTS